MESQNNRPPHRLFAHAFQVDRSPSGSLRLRNDEVLLSRDASGRLCPWRPQNVEVGEGIELVDEPQITPRRLFDFDDEDDENDVGGILGAQLAEALALDSGSEEEDTQEELTDQQLLEMLDDELPDRQGDEDEVDVDYDWSEDFTTFNGTQSDFREEVGPKIDGTSPSQIFCQLWDQPLVETIVGETNDYARQTIEMASESETGISDQSRINEWTETSVSEIYRLIAVILTLGMCLRSRVEEYWTTGLLEMPKFRKIMSLNRYLLLMRFIHFVDNNFLTERGEGRKIAKIKPLLDYLNKKFKAVYSPRRELAIDESLLLWKGRLSWVQCIRTKAARFGIKSYELCESVSGYVLDIILYTGKDTTAAAEAVYGFVSSTAKIVLKLMTGYLGKGFCLFMDNYYNSIPLCRFLKRKKTDVVGTLNRRRVDTPEQIKSLNDKRMARGTMVSRHCGDVSVVAWKDVKLVTTVSTYHNADVAPDQRAGRPCPKPKVVQDYNKFMGGVDLKDQKLAMYLLERKRGVKWYIKVFKRLLNITILNSYIIYCTNIGQHRKMTHRQFRYKLIEELMEKYGLSSKPRSRHTTVLAEDRINHTLHHFPEQLEMEGERTKVQNKYKRARCTVCLSKKIRTMTSISCSHCKVFLCVGQCWREHHTQ